MLNGKKYQLPRILMAIIALFMAAATIPAYFEPTANPGLAAIAALCTFLVWRKED